MTVDGLRRLVLDALDDYHESTGGDTPDHIIVSERDYEALREKWGRGVETLNPDNPHEYTTSGDGYIGMHLWHSAALDGREERAIMLPEELFQRMFPSANDFSEAKPFYTRSPNMDT